MKSVYISSTTTDLQEHLVAVLKAIHDLELNPINVDDLDTQSDDDTKTDMAEIQKADIFIGIVAHRYDNVRESVEKSSQEQEYEEAVIKDIPRLMYVVDENYDWQKEYKETDEVVKNKLINFKAKIATSESIRIFTTPEQLAQEITQDLTNWLQDQGDVEPPSRERTPMDWGFIGVVVGIIGVVVAIIAILIALFTPEIRDFLYPPTAPSPTPLEGQPALESEIVVVIAQFEGEYDAQIDLLEVLTNAASQVENVRVISISHPIANREQAQHVGQIYGATMVVYGRIAAGGVTANYEILNENVVYQVESKIRVNAEQVENFDVFLYEGMDANYILGFSLGQLYYFDDRYEDAIAAFNLAETGLDINRANALDADMLFFYLGNIYYVLEKYDLAITNYNRSIDLNNNRYTTYYNRGIALHILHNYAQAIANYNRAIELNVDYVNSYINRGIAYADSGEFDQAILDYNRAIELDPDNPMVYNNRGNVYRNIGDYEQATRDYDRATEIDQSFAFAYLTHANSYFEAGNYEDAIAIYNRIIELGYMGSDIYNNLGNAYFMLENYDMAIANFSQVIDLDSQHAIAYNSRGWAYYSIGNYTSALGDINRSLEIDPNEPTALHSRGAVYLATEKYELALEDFDKSIELGLVNMYPNVYTDRGKTHVILGDYEAALDDFTKYEEVTGEELPEEYIKYREQAQAALDND